MGDERIFSGGKLELRRIPDFESSFQEGDEGHLDLHLSFVPPGTATFLATMAAGLRSSGVVLPKDPEVVGKTVRIHFKKMIAPLLFIVAALGTLIFLALLRFDLFRKNLFKTAFIFPNFVWGLLIAGVLALILVVVGVGAVMAGQRRVSSAVAGS